MINKEKVVEFRDEFQKAVKQLEKDFGVAISLGSISFNANELRGKMTARIGTAQPKLSASDFQIGDIVFINHKKIANTRTFEIQISKMEDSSPLILGKEIINQKEI